jgi:hypothetical protein
MKELENKTETFFYKQAIYFTDIIMLMGHHL